jgi:anti-sigma factor RsiW
VSEPQITCREMVELMSDYLDGSLDAPERARFEAHLASCDGCTRALEQLRATVRVTGSLREEPIADEQRELLRAVFRDWRSGR